MKRYYFTWYNYIAQEEQTDFVLANSETEAKQIAVLIMKYFAGNSYDQDSIENFGEVSDDYYYTMDEMKRRYAKSNKEFVLPEIKEEEEDD